MAGTPLYLPFHLGFSAALVGHAITTRLTYTVPAGKIAECCVSMQLGEPVGGSGFVACNFIYTINAVNIGVVASLNVAGYSGIIIPHIYLTAGDVLVIQTNNSGAINTVYNATIEIKEYQ